MMTINEPIELIVEVLILLLLLYLAFFKSYFQEKGKNLATKEDVEEITSLVETIKSQLEFSLQAKLSLREEEHQALVDYFSKYAAWVSAITNISFAGINYKNMSRFEEIRSQLTLLHQDFALAAGKMELFVESEEIHLQHGSLAIQTLQFQGLAEQATFAAQEIELEVEEMLIKTPLAQQVEQYRALLEKKKEFYAKFKEEQLESYKALAPNIQRQRKSISKHIRALVNG